jgi:hypothetical protein
MPSSIVVILVGGPNATGKTKFYNLFTGGNSGGNKINIRTTLNTIPTFVLVDTPNTLGDRNPYEYCWEGIFHMGHIVVNFGDWTPAEVYGMRSSSSRSPSFLTWSGDDVETMNRIMDKVLEIV